MHNACETLFSQSNSESSTPQGSSLDGLKVDSCLGRDQNHIPSRDNYLDVSKANGPDIISARTLKAVPT